MQQKILRISLVTAGNNELVIHSVLPTNAADLVSALVGLSAMSYNTRPPKNLANSEAYRR